MSSRDKQQHLSFVHMSKASWEVVQRGWLEGKMCDFDKEDHFSFPVSHDNDMVMIAHKLLNKSPICSLP